MRAAGPQARFMHCLPAERGIECTEGVVESGERAGGGGRRGQRAVHQWAMGGWVGWLDAGAAGGQAS